jgi:hypothetical protein
MARDTLSDGGLMARKATSRRNEVIDAEDKTWAAAVTYLRDMAARIRSLTRAYVGSPVVAELAIVRAEALEEAADSMERVAAKVRDAEGR